jgi:hypothetical protein
MRDRKPIKFKVEGTINDEEQVEIENDIKYLLENKKSERCESGYFGIRQAEKIGDELWFDIYRVVGIARVKVKHISKHNVKRKRA